MKNDLTIDKLVSKVVEIVVQVVGWIVVAVLFYAIAKACQSVVRKLGPRNTILLVLGVVLVLAIGSALTDGSRSSTSVYAKETQRQRSEPHPMPSRTSESSGQSKNVDARPDTTTASSLKADFSTAAETPAQDGKVDKKPEEIATGSFANNIARHSSGAFTLRMPDGWGWRETTGPFPNGDGASVDGEALFWLMVAPASNDDVDIQSNIYLPIVERRWFDAAVAGHARGTQVDTAPATAYDLVFNQQSQMWELRTIIFCRGGNVIIGAMRTPPELAAKYEPSLREILSTVAVRPLLPLSARTMKRDTR